MLIKPGLYPSYILRREIIVHELLYLKVPSHGKVFRSLLKAHLAEAGRLRQPSRWLYSCISDSAG
jgi:predicted metal-dependent hydrolase